MKRTMSKNDFYRRFSFFLLDKVIDDIRYERFYFTNPLKFLTTKDFFLEEIKEDKISVLDFIERYFEKLKSN